MATYKEIKGVTVQTRDEDPSVFIGAWASGGSLNQVRNGVAGANSGTPSAGLAFGGYTGTAQTGDTEEYNGTSWSEQNNLNTARSGPGGVGIQTAAMAITGNAPPMTVNNEQYDGTSWTEVNNVNTARDNILGGFGTNTAAVIGGGRTATPATFTANTESWDGSSWTEVNDLNNARSTNHSGAYNDGIAAGGYVAPPTAYNNKVETWDGTSWTETTEMNTLRGTAGSSGASEEAFLLFGGENPAGNASQKTENWNGSAWTEVADLGTPHTSGVGGAGTNTAALAFGGSTSPGPRTGATEEWSFPSSPILVEGMVFLSGGTTLKGFGKSVPTGTFSSGGNLNTKRLDATAGGSAQNSFLFIAGYPNSVLVESYNGTSWTEIADVNTSRQLGGASAQAPAPTMLFFGGNPSPGYKLTESFDGTSWTEVGDLNTNRDYSGGGAGAGTSALCVGGYGNPAAYLAITESWNGTSWTEVGDLNVARYGGATGGSQTSARCVAGAPPTNPPAAGDKNEGWDGTSWTEAAEHSDNSAARAGFGDNRNFFMVAGGNSTASSEFWNGTSWTETGDTAGSGQRINMGGGTTVAGIITKSSGPDAQAKSTEEFNCEDGLLNISVS